MRHTVTVGVISATERPFPVTDGRIERDAADRRGDQSGQLRRAAAQPPRRGDRHQHRDHQQRPRSEGNIGIGFAVPINTVRDLLPQLHTGKVIRGRIGVQISAVPRDGYRGLRPEVARRRARRRASRRAARPTRAGIEPGDVIIEFNGRPVTNTNELREDGHGDQAGHVGAGQGDARTGRSGRSTSPSTSSISRPSSSGTPGAATTEREPPEEQGSDSFGLTLEQPDAADARGGCSCRPGSPARVITDVDPERPVGRRAAPGRRHPVGQRPAGVERRRSGPRAAAGRSRAASRRSCVWRGDGEVFVTVRKE